jgi:hypothetical protein
MDYIGADMGINNSDPIWFVNFDDATLFVLSERIAGRSP